MLSYPRVTLGICTRNCESVIAKCLQSLSSLNYPKNLLEVIIVDGCSTDRTLQIVRRILEDSKIKHQIATDDGLGLGYARQIIVEKASAEFIAFVDADQFLHYLWLKKIIKELRDNHVAVVRGIQRSSPYTSSLAQTLEGYKISIQDSVVPRKIEISGFGMGGSVLRKSAILEVGGFDPAFNITLEDAELCVRLEKKGWRLINCRTAVFFHQPRATWRALFKQYRNWAIGSVRLMEKHGQIYETKKQLFTGIILSFCFGIRDFFKIYKSTHDPRSILLPIEYVFTRTAYCLGRIIGSRSNTKQKNEISR